jgi:5'-phosphate synthase pdxT subunit
MPLRLVSNKPSVIGVLDLQGGVQEHLEHLDAIGIPYKRVKQASDFPDLAGLIIPGGESTCVARLLDIFQMKDPIINAHRNGMKIWGTCAGTILLAKEVVGEIPCLGLIDIVVERNSFGSQLDSFISEAIIPAVAAEPIPLTFIRAPKIIHVGNDVKVLLKRDDYIAAAENENVLLTIFHPELTGNLAFHRYFALKCGLNPSMDKQDFFNSQWKTSSWTKHSRIA